MPELEDDLAPDAPTGETPSAGDPLVAALTDVAVSLERFSGRLAANGQADDELRNVVVRALEVSASRNLILDRIEVDEKRRADAAARTATAEEARLDLAKQEGERRAATAEARWKAISASVGGYVGSVMKHPITVAIGGALLLGIAQVVSSKLGFDVTQYMATPTPTAIVAPDPVIPPHPHPEPGSLIDEVQP